MKPRIFISAVTKELKTARQLVANTLLTMDFDPVWQDIFETSGEEIRPMLRRQIDSCSAVLQIVGDAYGFEPQTQDDTFKRITRFWREPHAAFQTRRQYCESFERVSYAQFEAIYAISKGRKVYYLIVNSNELRDANGDKIDIALDDSDNHRADAEARRKLQSEYKARVQSSEHMHYCVENADQLQNMVLQLRSELIKLRLAYRYWMISVAVALVLILAGVGFIQYQQDYERKRQERERYAQRLERVEQQKERLAAEKARRESQKVENVHRTQAYRFLQILLADKNISPEAARQRAIKELPMLVDLPFEEIQAIIDRELRVSTPEHQVTQLELARALLAQGNYDGVFQVADYARAEGREMAMLEGIAALAKFRESPQPEWNERAATAFGRALDLSERDSKEWAEAAVFSASVLHELSRYAPAEELLVAALKIQENHLGEDSPRVADVLNNLAALLLATNRLAEAEPQLRRALAIDERYYGAEHPDVANDLNNLAQLLHKKNRLPEAEQLMRRALAIYEQSDGAEHPDAARALNNLARLLQATNRLAEAEPRMRRALAIIERSYGADHPSCVRVLNSLALLLKATNRLAEAEPLMRRALAIDEQSYGAEHPDVAADLNNLATLLQETSRLREAEPLMRRALTIYERSYGADHPDVAGCLNNLAMLLLDTNRTSESEPLMRRALTIYERSYGPEHSDVARAINNLAQLLQDTNRLAEAEPLMRRALAIDERSYGADHPDVARELNNLATLFLDTNRLAEAEPLMRRALAIDELSYGAEHPDVARDLNNLAALLLATNRMAEAEMLSRRCVAIFNQFRVRTGHEHPRMMTVLGNHCVLLEAIKVPEVEIAQIVKEAMAAIDVKLMPITPEVDQLLGPAKPVADVLAALDRQYQAVGKSEVYFLPPNKPIAPFLDELCKQHPASLNASGVGESRKGEHAKSIAYYDESLKILSNRPDAVATVFAIRMNRAAALLELAELESARNELREILIGLREGDTITPIAKGLARYYLAKCEWRLNDLEAAKREAEQSLTEYGDDEESSSLKVRTKQLLVDISEMKQLSPLPNLNAKKELQEAKTQFEARAKLAKLSIKAPSQPLLDQMLGPAESTNEILKRLDEQYREQGKSKVWFLPLTETIAPHLDELLGPIERTDGIDTEPFTK